MTEPCLSDHLSDAFEPEELAHGLSSVKRRVAHRRRHRRVIAVAAVLAPVVLLALATTLILTTNPGPLPAPSPSSSPPLALANGAPVPAHLAPDATVHLDDGSTVRARSETDLRLLRNGVGEVAFELRGGTARFDVVPGQGRRWRVEVGRMQVEVLGTSFTVHRDGDAASVAVHRGRVSVVADGRPHILVAGERLSLAPESSTMPADAPSADPPGPESSTMSADSASADPPAPEPIAASARREGTPPPTVAALLERADSSRRAGAPDEAVRSLLEIARRHPRAPEASSAALSWGQIEEDRGDLSAAAEAYASATRLGGPAPLHELAWYRLVRVCWAAGDRGAARAAAQDYASRFPDGSRRVAIDAIVADP